MTDVDVEFGEGLEQMEEFAFLNCYSLRRVAMPLKMDLISDNIFQGCTSMANIELVGEVHSTISHFSLQVWRDEMKDEIDMINQVLATAPIHGKTAAARRWIRRVLARVKHFTNEHNRSLEESAALLELSLRRDNLKGEIDHGHGSESSLEAKPKKRARMMVSKHALLNIQYISLHMQHWLIFPHTSHASFRFR